MILNQLAGILGLPPRGTYSEKLGLRAILPRQGVLQLLLKLREETEIVFSKETDIVDVVA